LEGVLASKDPSIHPVDGHSIAYEAILQECPKFENAPVLLMEDSEPVVSDPIMAEKIQGWMAISKQVAVGNRRRVLEDGADKEKSDDEEDPNMVQTLVKARTLLKWIRKKVLFTSHRPRPRHKELQPRPRSNQRSLHVLNPQSGTAQMTTIYPDQSGFGPRRKESKGETRHGSGNWLRMPWHCQPRNPNANRRRCHPTRRITKLKRKIKNGLLV
jgi:hypothetical protein